MKRIGVGAIVMVGFVSMGCANDPAPPRWSPSTHKPDPSDALTSKDSWIDATETDSDTTSDGSQSEKGYPAGPYGVKPGSVIADMTWQGWHNPVSAGYDISRLEKISLSDFYDPTGKKGYRAIVLNASARWCSVCKLEQSHLRQQRDKWQSEGVVFIGSLFAGITTEPATYNDMIAWSKTYKIDWIFVHDPSNQLSLFFDPASSPMNMVIDATTMKIKDIVTGLPEDSWWEKQLGPLTQ